jgi:hypothetical protein
VSPRFADVTPTAFNAGDHVGLGREVRRTNRYVNVSSILLPWAPCLLVLWSRCAHRGSVAPWSRCGGVFGPCWRFLARKRRCPHQYLGLYVNILCVYSLVCSRAGICSSVFLSCCFPGCHAGFSVPYHSQCGRLKWARTLIYPESITTWLIWDATPTRTRKS